MSPSLLRTNLATACGVLGMRPSTSGSPPPRVAFDTVI
jgi:hypothetical protein